MGFKKCSTSDSNIKLFSIAPHLVIALPTLRKQKLSLLISLLQFLYEFCSFGSWLLFCIASHIVIALPTIATAIGVALLRS